MTGTPRISSYGDFLTALLSARERFFEEVVDGIALGPKLRHGILTIVTLGMPALTLAMTSASVLRSLGDARRGMNVTLYGAVVNTLLDKLSNETMLEIAKGLRPMHK